MHTTERWNDEELLVYALLIIGSSKLFSLL